MPMDPRVRGLIYLEHLTRADRELLARVAGAHAGIDVDVLVRRPERVEHLLADPVVYDAVFAPASDRSDPLSTVSPFLAFAVAVQRGRVELAELPYVQEWTGPRQRLPVFTGDELRSFLDDPDHRLFVTELLASYTHVRGGTVTVRRHGVIHRRTFTEIDLTSLAGLLDLVTEEARPGLYRRLGDLALLLTGVFPDHTARNRFAPIEVERLARALDPGAADGHDRLLEALSAQGAIGLIERLGQQWYALAVRSARARSGTVIALDSVGERFVDARRVLNHLTDRHLFPFRARWFPAA